MHNLNSSDVHRDTNFNRHIHPNFDRYADRHLHGHPTFTSTPTRTPTSTFTAMRHNSTSTSTPHTPTSTQTSRPPHRRQRLLSLIHLLLHRPLQVHHYHPQIPRRLHRRKLPTTEFSPPSTDTPTPQHPVSETDTPNPLDPRNHPHGIYPHRSPTASASDTGTPTPTDTPTTGPSRHPQ